MDRKIIENLIYNTTYQILTLILPFITIPYISRVFEPEILGIYSSSFANVSLIGIVGMFAINVYGTRVIAENRQNKYSLSKKYFEVRKMQLITTIIAFFVYIIMFVIMNDKLKVIYFLQGINIIAIIFDISWLYMGIEDFKKIVIRNAIVKVISILLVFALVKTSDNLITYILIISGSTLCGNVVMWKYRKRIVENIKLEKYNIIYNLKESFFLMLPLFCFQIYTSFDRSILASVSTLTDVAMFDQSQKIIRMTIGIVTSLGIVMLPRVSNMISNNTCRSDMYKVLKASFNLTLLISCGATFGLMAISKNLIPWFYGEEYLNIFNLIFISSVVCILTSIGSFLSNQYAIPTNNKKAYINPICIAAITSVILNIILGRKYGALGSVITVVLVELIALILRIFYLKKELNFKYLFSGTYKFLIAGIIMYFGVCRISNFFNLPPNIMTTIIEIFVGIIIYIFVILILNRSYYKKIMKKVKLSCSKDY